MHSVGVSSQLLGSVLFIAVPTYIENSLFITPAVFKVRI